jgi:hypothetical protein
MKTKCKTSKRLKNVQSSFLGFLGLLDGHPTPDEDKMQNFKKAQKRTKFVFGVSWFARRPPRMKTKCKTSKRLKIVQSSFLGFKLLLNFNVNDWTANEGNINAAANSIEFVR